MTGIPDEGWGDHLTKEIVLATPGSIVELQVEPLFDRLSTASGDDDLESVILTVGSDSSFADVKSATVWIKNTDSDCTRAMDVFPNSSSEVSYANTEGSCTTETYVVGFTVWRNWEYPLPYTEEFFLRGSAMEADDYEFTSVAGVELAVLSAGGSKKLRVTITSMPPGQLSIPNAFRLVTKDTSGPINGYESGSKWMAVDPNICLDRPRAPIWIHDQTCPPTLVSVARGPFEHGVKLSWNWNAPHTGLGEVGFVIERKVVTCPVWTVVGTVPHNQHTFIDPYVPRGKPYEYRVAVAFASGGTTFSDGMRLNRVPTLPDVDARILGNLTLEWAPLPDASSYLVRSVAPPGPEIALGPNNVFPIQQPTGTTHDYEIWGRGFADGPKTFVRVATSAAGNSAISLAAVYVSTPSSMTLLWAPVAGATSYQVKRSVSAGGEYALVASVDDTRYVDAGATPGSYYGYQVIAVNAAGAGPSGMISITTPHHLWLKNPIFHPGGLTGGTFAFSLCDATPGRDYLIEVSENLDQWMEFQRLTASSSSVEVSDPLAISFPHRYYRVQSAQEVSANAVGYVIDSIPLGWSMKANPLNFGANSIEELLPFAPLGTIMYKYSAGGYSVGVFDEFDWVWMPGGVTLAPGEGAWFHNPDEDFTKIFVGDIVQGRSEQKLRAGFSMVSSRTLRAGGLTSVLGLAPDISDTVYKFGQGGYSTYWFDEFDLVWMPIEPQLGIGESFFIRTTNPRVWTQHYRIWP
jgi:hypothetical protein